MSYLGVGIAFLPLAIALWITLDNWTFALPFVILAMTFFIMSAKSAPAYESGNDDDVT